MRRRRDRSMWGGLTFVMATVGLAASPAARAEAPAARIWLGGDVHLAPRGSDVLGAISRLVDGAPGIVNLEGPIADRPATGPGLRLVNPPSAPVALRAAGVRVATLANNHAGDAGPAGPAATARALRDAGVLPAGGPAGFALLAVGAVRVAVTAHDIDDRGDLGESRGAERVGLDSDGVATSLDVDLRRARRAGDVLVATFHVRAAATYLPSAALGRVVQRALAAGASVVAVHGSHLAARVERRGRAVIAWGLGNLAFACDCTREGEAVLLEVEVAPGRAGAAWVIPIAAGLAGAPAAPAPDAAGIFDLLNALGSSPLVRSADRAAF